MSCPGSAVRADSANGIQRRTQPLIFLLICAIWLFSPADAEARGKPSESERAPLEILVPSGSVWKYLDDGSNQGTAWIAPDFDDSDWSEGPARLGYGDDGEITVVENGSEINTGVYMTTYLRRTFEVAEASVLGRLQLRVLRDDGVVVYLNGQEIARSNMPDGPVNYLTRAASSVANETEQFFYLTEIVGDAFVNGTNVLAVELHQFRNTSFDLGFDLELLDQTGARFCFGVADGDNNLANEDLLVQLDIDRAEPTVIGRTGTFGVEAIAFEIGGERLFAADQGQLVLLDLLNGSATPFPQTAGTGDGVFGLVEFDDLDGLTFDVIQDVLYASQRLVQDDVLIQIDPETGAHVPDAFGPGLDYVPIVWDGLPGDDIDDIASDPFTGVMYGLANERGGPTGLIRIDPATGQSDLIAILGIDDLEGLAFFNEGQLFGSTGTLAGPQSNTVFLIDKETGVVAEAAGFGIGTEFEGLGCLSDPGIATIGDRVWNDLDADGIQDPGEPGLPGVTVRLYDSNEVEIATALSDGDGVYRFEDLLPGYYAVGFDLPPDYEFSPQTQGSDTTLDSDPGILGEVALPLLLSGEARLHIDAGMFTTGSIGDRTWEDLDGDGIQGVGEPGLGAIVVELLDTDNNVLESTVTSPSGFYQFTDLHPGLFRVRFSNLPSDYTWTFVDQGTDDQLDSDAGLDGRSGLVVVESSRFQSGVDAGAIRPTGVGDRAWHDVDGDGIQDFDEPDLDGVVVDLIDRNGTVIDTATTVGGTYDFAELFAGPYTLRFVPPAGFAFSPAGQGGDHQLDSDVLGSDGRTAMTTLLSGLPRSDIDAGLHVPASLGDRVWQDMDADGLQDPAESGLAGVTVELLSTSGALVAMTVTAEDGSYHFSGMVPGRYLVRVVAPAGYLFSPAFQGNNTLDSNMDANGVSNPVQLISGETRLDFDAGLFETVSIGDRVWEDLNINGLQEGNEPSIDGASVELLDASGTVLSSTVTGGGGLYTFRGLEPGDYRVRFILPQDFSFSPVDQGSDDTRDSDADETTGESPLLTLLAGELRTDIDAGLWTIDPNLVALVGDRVWEDLNGNGLQDPGEPGIAGAAVHLIDAATNTVFNSTVSAGDGFYSFPSVPEGTYRLRVEPPGGYAFTHQGLPGALDDSDIDPVSGMSGLFTLAAGESRTDLDAGLFLPASVGDRVWEDVDEDGLQNGEFGLDGVRILLYDIAGDLVAATTTSGGGIYGFSGLMPGEYRLEILPPPGLFPVQRGQGTDPELDSDFDPISNSTPFFNLLSGENRTDQDAGLGLTAAVPEVPTLSFWGVLLLGALLAYHGLRSLRATSRIARRSRSS